MIDELQIDHKRVSDSERQRNLARTDTWARFEDAAREAIAAGNDYSFLLHTLKQQQKAVDEAHDTLEVRPR